MKRLFSAALCLLLLLTAAGCAKTDAEVQSGCYFLESGEDTFMVPYLYLDLENNSAHLSGGMAISYAETGTVTLNGTQLLVETVPTTYVFRIQEEKTLILTDCTGENPFDLPMGGKLIRKEEWN